MNGQYRLLSGALRVFHDFSEPGENRFEIEHDTKNPKFELLRGKYRIDEIAGTGGDFSKAERLMRWVYDNVLHEGGGVEAAPEIQPDPLSILDYSFRKGRMPGIVCRHQAIVFTECCLSAGLFARTLHCLPYSPYDFETHVASMVYISGLNKWVLFDPGNRAYFTDQSGVPLSPLEAREGLGENNSYVSAGTRMEERSYKAYMAKNLFYFKFQAKNTFGTDLIQNQKTYHLAPRGFDIRWREIDYCEYAIKNSPEGIRKGWEDALPRLKAQKIALVSQDQFLRIE